MDKVYTIVTTDNKYKVVEKENKIVIKGTNSLQEFLINLDNSDNPYIIEEGE